MAGWTKSKIFTDHWKRLMRFIALDFVAEHVITREEELV
jgi:hypothetical protein